MNDARGLTADGAAEFPRRARLGDLLSKGDAVGLDVFDDLAVGSSDGEGGENGESEHCGCGDRDDNRGEADAVHRVGTGTGV